MVGFWKGSRNSCGVACPCGMCTWSSDLLWRDVLHAHLFCGGRIYVSTQRRGTVCRFFHKESKKASSAICDGERLFVAVFLGQGFALWRKPCGYPDSISCGNSLFQKSMLYNGIYQRKSGAFRHPECTALVLNGDVSYVSVV